MTNSLEESVRDYCRYLSELSIEGYKRETTHEYKFLTMEQMAKKFGVNEQEMAPIFIQLEQNGFISQPEHLKEKEQDSGIYLLHHPLILLFDAIRTNKPEKIKDLLTKHIDINDTYKGISALHYALLRSSPLSMIHFLLALGADPLPNNHLYILKESLKQYNTPDVFFTLLDACPHTPPEDQQGNTLVYDFIQKFEFDLDRLFSYGFSVDHQNQSKQTPLMIACVIGMPKTIQFLLEKGASIQLTDRFNHSAFRYAYGSKHAGMLRYFLSYQDKLDPEEQKLLKEIRLKLLFQEIKE